MASTEQLEHAATGRDRTLRMIRTSISSRGYGPTLSEIARECGVSKRTARLYLDRLAQDGRIEVDAGVARGIRLVP